MKRDVQIAQNEVAPLGDGRDRRSGRRESAGARGADRASRLASAATRRHRRAFTLVEVMIASLVLVFGIVSAISAMQSGVRAMDRTRKLALATQVLQTEMEQLRLKSWAQLDPLSGTATFTPDSAAAGASAFTCTRTIASPKSDMKEITLTAEWRGSDGRMQSAKLVTRYGKNGLNDYISTTH